MIYQHILVIRSEHEDYGGDLERLARDAVDGDARLSAWSKEEFPLHLLTEDELSFFCCESCGEPLADHRLEHISAATAQCEVRIGGENDR